MYLIILWRYLRTIKDHKKLHFYNEIALNSKWSKIMILVLITKINNPVI